MRPDSNKRSFETASRSAQVQAFNPWRRCRAASIVIGETPDAAPESAARKNAPSAQRQPVMLPRRACPLAANDPR